MKKSIAFATAIFAFLCIPNVASAEELWNAYPLRGFWEGLPMGTTPPKGVYGLVSSYWASDHSYDNHGGTVPDTGVSAFVVTPIIEWNPGRKILGGDYSLGIAQPLAYTSAPGLAGSSGRGNWGTFNTVLLPAQIGWHFKELHVKTGVGIYLPDAKTTIADLRTGKLRNGGLPSGSNFTTVEPDLSASWLHHGWSVTASLHVAVPVTDSIAAGYRFHSGAEFAADYTIAKTIGNWTFGAGGHQVNQFEDDHLNGERVPEHRAVQYGVGPIAGYQLGTVNFLAMWNRTAFAKNTVAGDFFQVRLMTKM